MGFLAAGVRFLGRLEKNRGLSGVVVFVFPCQFRADGKGFGRMKLLRWLGVVLVLAGGVSGLRAHQVASVEFDFIQSEKQWTLAGEMDLGYMLPETRNVPGAKPLSRSVVLFETPEVHARYRRETEVTLRKLLNISFGGKEIAWRIEFPDFQKTPFNLPMEAGDIALYSTRLVMDALPGAGELRVKWAGEQETELIILIGEGDEAQILSALPGAELMLLKQAGSGVAEKIVTPVTGGWVQKGFRHVIPKGLDHMLFILGLFLLLPRWKPLLGQSLLFTIAHSITLGLAVFGVVQVPGKIVEILIAVSIAWIGIENLLTRKLGKQRLFLVFGFGLLHGLGFASVLAELLGGIPKTQLIGPLLGFNVGVELAQMTILAAAFAVLWPLRKYTRQCQTVGSVLIALAGIGWAIQRTFYN
jgi:HupE / UreJ protein